jgi:hypothetical protein
MPLELLHSDTRHYAGTAADYKWNPEFRICSKRCDKLISYLSELIVTVLCTIVHDGYKAGGQKAQLKETWIRTNTLVFTVRN